MSQAGFEDQFKLQIEPQNHAEEAKGNAQRKCSYRDVNTKSPGLERITCIHLGTYLRYQGGADRVAAYKVIAWMGNGPKEPDRGPVLNITT
jgi:hypothetical protein